MTNNWPYGALLTLLPCFLLSCFPCTLLPAPCFPCSLLPSSLLPAVARLAVLEPRGPFRGGRQAGRRVYSGVGWGYGGVVYPWACPRGMPRGHPTTPYPTPHRCTHDVRHAGLRGTGLWAQGGSQGPGDREPGSEAAWRLLYLRSFSPGTQNRPKAGYGNDWIGSRSKPAQGGLSVQDLVGLSFGCASRVVRPDGTGRERDGRDGTGLDGTDEWGRLNIQKYSGGAASCTC